LEELPKDWESLFLGTELAEEVEAIRVKGSLHLLSLVRYPIFVSTKPTVQTTVGYKPKRF